MKTLTMSVMLLSLALGQAVAAQDTGGNGNDGMMNNTRPMPGMFHHHGAGPHPDMGGPGMMMGHGDHGRMMGRLQSPRLLMRFQDELGLTAKQIDAVKKAMKDFQNNKIDAEWELQSSNTALCKELEKDTIDRDRALSLLDKVSAAESSLQRQHLAMLIAVHNVLTRDQIRQLGDLVHRPVGLFRFHGKLQPMKSGRQNI